MAPFYSDHLMKIRDSDSDWEKDESGSFDSDLEK